MRKTCLDCIHQLAREDERIVFVGSDLGAGTLEAMKREMPERFFMEGISEAHIIGMSAGLAMEGRIVYVNTIATFLTRRCFEQIVLDLALHQCKVRLIGSGGGLVYAPLGPTHEAFDDIAILRTIPGMTILAAADASEMKRLMPVIVDHPGPIYIRLGKGGDPIVTPQDQPFELGRPYSLRNGQDALILSTGTMASMALEAAELLEQDGIQISVVHLPTLKPMDVATVHSLVSRFPTVMTLEEHSQVGGLGSAIAEILAESMFNPHFHRMALPDTFPSRYGNQASLLAHCGLTVSAVAKTIQNLHTKT